MYHHVQQCKTGSRFPQDVSGDPVRGKVDSAKKVRQTKILDGVTVSRTRVATINCKDTVIQEITSDALEYAFSAHEIINPELQNQLLQAYHQLDCYPEVPETLKWLKDRGFGAAILSNGSSKMLASGVNNSGLEKLIDSVLSVEEVGVFKPDPRVYQLAVEQLKTEAGKILFFSSNA